MSHVTDIADYLEDQNIGDVGVDIFEGDMPDTPDTMIGVFERPGAADDRYLPIANPGVQVISRSNSYDTALNNANAIGNLLHEKRNVELITNGVYFYYIFKSAGIIPLGQDESGRFAFSVLFICKIKK